MRTNILLSSAVLIGLIAQIGCQNEVSRECQRRPRPVVVKNLTRQLPPESYLMTASVGSWKTKTSKTWRNKVALSWRLHSSSIRYMAGGLTIATVHKITAHHHSANNTFRFVANAKTTGKARLSTGFFSCR
ncbi:MAG: hypothetical protein AAF939_12765, partial [Planctomycetota bacterium]